MAGKPQALSNTSPALGALQVQTSTNGMAIGQLWGRPRVPGNLIWYGNFKAIPRTENQSSGGKGGGSANQGTTSYSYQAAVAMAIGAGPVNGVISAWRGKERLTGQSISTRTRTLRHRATVPAGGTVTVPEAASFYRHSAVRDTANTSSGRGQGQSQSGVLVSNVDYQRSGGTYTLPNWIGREVEIEYQVQDNAGSNSALLQIGLGLATGVIEQGPWTYLSANHPSQALGYAGIAYLYQDVYPLDSGAQVPNHTFEVSTPSEFSASIPDADMSRVLEEFLTDGHRGALWPAARLASLASFQAYCRAHSFFMSPALLEQATAAETLKRWLQLCNADAVWSGLQLKIVPLGDESKTANGATYTANNTPVYDLTPQDFLQDGDAPRIKIAPRPNEDAYNHIRVEFQNRANDYNVEVMSAKDLAHIEQFGERTMEVIKAHEVKTAQLASQVAHIELQRQMCIWNRYTFRLPWTKGRLEPLDLVTLTDPDLYLDRVPVRIQSIRESDDDFEVEAQDAPLGHASAPLYGAQAGSGFALDFNASPGSAQAPVIFELPGVFSASGLELAVATAGSNPLWGGCQVWVSYDGTRYQQIGELRGSSRYGTASALAAGATSAAVQISAGQLLSGSADDLAALATLCYVGGASPEYIAYETATLTGPQAYTLGNLVRGAYGSADAAHAAASAFVRVDDALARSGPLDPALVGKTVLIKLTSFNVFGGGQQSLADVASYAYLITGQFIVATGGGAGFSLQSSAQAYTFNGSNLAAPTSQTITLKAVNPPAAVVWEAKRYDATGTLIDDVTAFLGGTGAVRTLSITNFGLAASCVVKATAGGASDQATLVRLRDGANSITGFLTNEAHVVATNPDGSGGNFGSAIGVFKVFNGIADVTSGGLVTFSFFSSSGVTGASIDAVGNYSVSGMTLDIGSAKFRAVFGGVTIEKVFSLSRSKTGPQGPQGSQGPAGQNIARPLIYRRAATSPALPSVTATFTFATGALSGLNNSWTSSVPSGSLPLWVSAASAVSAGATDDIAAAEWSAPTVLAQDGAAGLDGPAGLNSATAWLYQRSNSTSAPTGPASTLTYTFASGLLSGTLGSWAQSAPAASNGKYLYMTQATAASTGATDTIPAGEWSTVRQIAADGQRGPVIVAWAVPVSEDIWSYGGGGSAGPADARAAQAISSVTGGDAPRTYDQVTLFVTGTAFSETRYLSPTPGFGWVPLAAWLSTNQMMPNAVTDIVQDTFDFGGTLFGETAIRTLVLTPVANCKIEFTGTLSAASLLVDSGRYMQWQVTPASGVTTVLHTVGTDDTARHDFPFATSFSASAGVALTFELRVIRPFAQAGVPVWKSSLRMTLVKR
jgi:hypothetical protein